MRSNVQTVLAVFETSKRYVVPLFQRQYVWTLDRQWIPLWEDIQRKAIERLRWRQKIDAAVGQEKTALQANPPAEHFLGAIVLDLQRTFGNEVNARLVIDGQQRLTTSQVCLAALRDVAAKHDVQDYSTEVAKHVANTGLMDDPDVERYKVWPSRYDQDAFKRIVDGGSTAEVAKAYPSALRAGAPGAPRLIQAYAFFVAQMEAFLAAPVLSEYLVEQPDLHQRVRALFETFKESLQVVSIELEGQDDPQVIFETLNARGENLLPSDLLRNYLFWKASKESPEHVQTLYDNYWKHFDSDFWKKDETQGRLKRPRVDLFFFNMLQMKTGTEVNALRLYHEYKTWTENPQQYPTAAAELTEIHRYSLELAKLFRPDDETDIGKFVQMLNIFDVKTVNSLLLGILAEGGLSREDLKLVLADLESYLVRRAVCGLTAAAYNRTFVTWMAKLFKEGISHEGLQRIMLAEEVSSALWPDDARFSQAWLNSALYPRLYTRGRMEYILRMLELKRRTNKTEDVPVRPGLTVEHVMPQAWIEHWPLADGSNGLTREQRLATPSPASERRDHVLQTIGNLTLLTGPANSKNRNLPFKDKVTAKDKATNIEEYSLLILNKYFTQRVAEGKGWDEEAIEERGRELFGLATKLWPHPGAIA